MENCNISYHNCRLCHRECGVKRDEGELGYCRSGSRPILARASLHMWEEPIISGTRGSGTVFFSGCSLGCVYCQNRVISHEGRGIAVDARRISEIMLRLEADGAHNVNFVTPTHFAPTVIEATAVARQSGLSVPIVYNTASYETPSTVRALEGSVDIYRPDLKYYRDKTAIALSHAPDYRRTALLAIEEMVRQQPTPLIADGLMKRGVIVRILLLPGHLAEAKLNLKQIYSTYGDSVYISLMSQYTPMPGMAPPLNRKVTNAEYSELLSYASDLGVTHAFAQEISSSGEGYIPDFDYSGL